MDKYIIAFVVLAVIAGGMLLPAFQPARESNCGPRDPEGELEQRTVAVVEPTAPTQMSSWPKDVAGLVNQLNGWHGNELTIYNEPESFPNQQPSGETGGWIGSHIEELKKLGANVRWDKSQKKYVIVEEE